MQSNAVSFYYLWYGCRLTCTDKFPNIPTKRPKKPYGGGGGGGGWE